MKILNAAQIRQWDAATIRLQGISSLELMERAARACVNWIRGRYTKEVAFLVICGMGNNGGDGLAISRLLIEDGYAVMPLLLRYADNLSADCRANLERLPSGAVRELRPGNFVTELPANIVIVDALFGTGLNRNIEGYLAEFIAGINGLPNEKVAVDMPSGLPADEKPGEDAPILKANHTLCFQQYKRSMLHREGGVFCGQIHLLDIGLDAEFPAQAEGHWYTADRDTIRQLFRPRQAFSHKGTFGTALIIGGSHGMIGAALLATQAAGRAGAGKVRALVPGCGYEIMQAGAPEAMCMTAGVTHLPHIDDWESAQGIGIGPGMGTDIETAAALQEFLRKVDRPIVIDADALNILAQHPSMLRDIPRHSILTPHPKELERLFGRSEDTFRRAELVRSKAMELELVIVAKDRYTMTALPDGRCFYNFFGNAGLATGGSGDVLCGIITGLLAQGYSSESAALIAVYLHAVAADCCAQDMALEAVLAGNIATQISEAYKTLY